LAFTLAPDVAGAAGVGEEEAAAPVVGAAAPVVGAAPVELVGAVVEAAVVAAARVVLDAVVGDEPPQATRKTAATAAPSRTLFLMRAVSRRILGSA
jgi:hypothetical protein